MSSKNYCPANRIIANVLVGVTAIGMGLYYGHWAGAIGIYPLAMAAFQFFVVDRLDGYRGYYKEDE